MNKAVSWTMTSVPKKEHYFSLSLGRFFLFYRKGGEGFENERHKKSIND